MTLLGVGEGGQATATATAKTTATAKAKAEVLRCAQNDKSFWWVEGEQGNGNGNGNGKSGFFAAQNDKGFLVG
jgi:hypothetical protein